MGKKLILETPCTAIDLPKVGSLGGTGRVDPTPNGGRLVFNKTLFPFINEQ